MTEQMADYTIYPPSSTPGLGWSFGCARRGASHLRNGMVCQDALMICTSGFGSTPCLAIAVADGHGDPCHDLSDIGASFAVRAAITEFFEFYTKAVNYGSQSQNLSEFKSTYARLITKRWRNMIQDYQILMEANNDEMPYYRFGATLLSCMIVKNTIYISQIGDGNIVYLDNKGNLNTPFTQNESLFGAETWSLSSHDAHLFCQTATIDCEEGGILILSTDGLYDSFCDDGLQYFKFIRSIADRIEEYGIERVGSQIGKWLDEYSINGSGDDITLAVAKIDPLEDGGY